jgi:hypothetical protein
MGPAGVNARWDHCRAAMVACAASPVAPPALQIPTVNPSAHIRDDASTSWVGLSSVAWWIV